MNPIMILTILQGLLGAAPQVLALFNQATSGQPVSVDEVKTALSQYGIDHALLVAEIAKAEAASGQAPPPPAA